jgi:hypothetical protein
MKLWLDDVRKPPDASWTWCKSVDEAIKFVNENECEEWALDHDLGGQLAHYGKGPYDYETKTGSHLCNDFSVKLPPRISIHSTNRGGVGSMVDLLFERASAAQLDIEIIVRPMRGRIMDKTPYYETTED